MASKRDNCIVLMISPPAPEHINPTLLTAFGEERSVHISLDLYQNAYRLARNFKDAIHILSFSKTPRHPDLTWLDVDDPGFLEAKDKNFEGKIMDAFQLAFNTGAKKAVLLSHLSPAVKPEWLYQAFEAANDKTIVLGLNQDTSIYALGLAAENLKFLEGISFTGGKTADEISEKAKKNKLSIFLLQETYSVNNEEALRKWTESKNLKPSVFGKTETLTTVVADKTQNDPKKHSKKGHKHETTPPQQDFEEHFF